MPRTSRDETEIFRLGMRRAALALAVETVGRALLALAELIREDLVESSSLIEAEHRQAWLPGAIDLNDGNWLSTSEAAFAAKVKVRTVYRWLSEHGDAFAVTSGGRHYIHSERFSAWRQGRF